jgi:uncharacterized protein (TIGR02996 family)
MTHEDAFLLDILEHPDDDTPRRIYADWLLDGSDPAGGARGEFIHVQCDLARHAGECPRPAALLARERELLDMHQREWGSLFGRLGCHCWEYRRGFVEGIGMPASAFLAQAATLFRSAPVRHLKLSGVTGHARALAESAHLARVTTLDLESNALDDPQAQALANSAHLGNVETLLLWSNRIGDDGVRALLAAPHLTRLTRLDLSANVIGDAGLTALTASPRLARLTMLGLERNQIGDEGARALLGSPHAAGTTRFDLSKNPIGEPTRAALRTRFGNRIHVWG